MSNIFTVSLVRSIHFITLLSDPMPVNSHFDRSDFSLEKDDSLD